MSMMLPICAPPDAGDRAPSFDIVRCDEAHGFKLDFYSLSDFHIGFDVHWSYGKTHVCTAPWGVCKFCSAGSAKRWVGYLAAMDDMRNKRFVVEFTPGCASTIALWLQERQTLRGRKMRLIRKSRHRCGPLSVEWHSDSQAIPAGQCPEPFDLQGVLCKVYDFEPDKHPEKPKLQTHADAVTDFLAKGLSPAAAEKAVTKAKAAEAENRLKKYQGNGVH